MAIHIQSVKIEPINSTQALLVKNIGNGEVQLTAKFNSHSKRKAVLPWKELWKIIFLRNQVHKDFTNSGLIRAAKIAVSVYHYRSSLALYFVPVNHFDLVCVLTADLKKALLVIK